MARRAGAPLCHATRSRRGAHCWARAGGWQWGGDVFASFGAAEPESHRAGYRVPARAGEPCIYRLGGMRCGRALALPHGQHGPSLQP